MRIIEKIYNSVKYRALAGLSRYEPTRMFKRLSPEEASHYYIYDERAYPFEKISVAGLEPAIASAFSNYAKYEQNEYVFHYTQGCVIEPQNGWAITKAHKLICASIPYYDDPELAPAPPSLLQYKYNRINEYTVDTAVSLRFGWGGYWSFINDVLGQIAALQKHNIPADIPIIIPKWAADISFVKQVFKRSALLRSRNWIVQDGYTYITVKNAYFCKNMPNVTEHFNRILDMLQIPDADPGQQAKIFLTRGANRKRRIRNTEEIEKIASALGFEIIDNDLLTIDQQIEVFARSQYVIGIHGAGLTNIIFRRNAPLHLFEIFPANLIPPHYFWLATGYNFIYDGMTGGEEQDGAFYLDPNSFKEKVSCFLNAQKVLT